MPEKAVSLIFSLYALFCGGKEVLDMRLGAVGAALLHLVKHMSVSIKRKGGGCVSHVFL